MNCSKCSQGCKTCNSLYYCYSCEEGYTLVSSFANIKKTCQLVKY